MPELNVQDIQRLIPNRFPMYFIDKVLDYEPEKSVTAVKNVTINEEFFVGHFPQEPVMPGVLIIESLAQAGAIPMLVGKEDTGVVGYLGSVDKAKFRDKVVPGDQLILKCEVLKFKRNVALIQGYAYVDDKKVAEAKLTYIIAQEN